MPGPGEPVQHAERIQVEVADEFPEIRFLLHPDGLLPVLERVAPPVMAAVEGPRVAGKEGAHGWGGGLPRSR